MSIDFAALAARLLQRSRSLLEEWFPEGKLHGHEYRVGSLRGEPGESLGVNVETGAWKDFATGEAGGDLISLYAAIHGLKQPEAARALAERDGIAGPAPAMSSEPKRPKWTPILPAPKDAPEPANDYYRRGPKDVQGKDTWIKLRFVARWAYRDAEGAILGYAVRFEWHEGDALKKDIVPQVYAESEGKRQWRWMAMPAPRPLYNLPELRSRPGDPVIVVEGEKKVEALRALAPQYVGVAWPGGAAAWRKVDWSPLAGRTVLCWPDADRQAVMTAAEAEKYGVDVGALIPSMHQPGMRAMWEIGHALLRLCPIVKCIIPDDDTLPDGWDAADAVNEGWDWQRFKAWALPRVQLLSEGGSNGVHERNTGRQRERGAEAHALGVPEALDQGVPAGSVRAGAPEDEHDGRVAADRERAQPAPHDRRTAQGSRRGGAGEPAERGGDRPPVGRASEDRGGAGMEAGLQGSRDVRASADALDRAREPGEAQASPLSQVGRWLKWGVERNGNGIPLTNLNNAVRVLEADPRLDGLVWFDEFLQRLMTGDPAREWTDADDINLTLYMQREIGISKLGREAVSQAVIAISMRDRRNCVREFFESQKHDGTPRIDEFLIRTFHCADTPYTRAASRNFWISMVARVMSPGCKVDNMLVLEGSQGLYKSTVLRVIADPWFAEQHESATNAKAFAEVLQGKLLIEISEMDAFDRAEVKRVKSTVSCLSDRYRASYARYATDHPRQGVMAGSTNKDDWNRDDTGARRFWPIRCNGVADVAYARQARAQCFAEAMAAYKAGATWYEMPEAETVTEQRKRYDADPWIEPISHWLTGRRDASVNEIAISCLHIELREIDRAKQMRIAGVLRALGWGNDGNKKRGGKVVKIWTPPADEYAGGSDFRAEPDGAGEVATQRSLPDIPFLDQ